jgi:hypothetical protein
VLMRLLKVTAGLVLMMVGVVLTFMPGPGVPVFAVGLGLVLSQSKPGLRTLARIRLAARRRFSPERIQAIEKRLPRDVVSHDTVQLRLNLEEYAASRKARRRSRR